jgi:hypothetical protein
MLIHGNINNCDIKSRIRIACENRDAHGNRFFCKDEYTINWLCSANDDTYRFKLVTTPSLKGYTMIVSDIEKAEVITTSQVPLIC